MKLIKYFKQVIFTSVLLLIFTTISFSSVSRYLTLQEMSIESTDIITAKVVSVKSFYQGNDKTKIFTSIKLEVLENHKGSCKNNEIIEIVRYGGTLNGKSIFQLEEPVFKKEQETLLFLKEYLSETFGRNYVVYGLSEGKFNIRNNKIFREYPAPLKLYLKGPILPITCKDSMDKNKFLSKIKYYK